jgi:hypothetical protein
MKKQFLVTAAALVVGLAAGYTAGRFQAGRFAMYSVSAPGRTLIYRYDKLTGKTWRIDELYEEMFWQEVPESEKEAAANAVVRKKAAAEAEVRKKAAEGFR